MLFRYMVKIVLALAMVVCCLFSCSKKGDFINEDKTGKGMHYFPLILNTRLYDTITHKFLAGRDTTFSRGQEIVFEIDYFSRDEISTIELWEGKTPNDLKKILEVPFQPSFYSPTKFIDTFLYHYTIPAGIDSTVKKWYIQPRVVTEQALAGTTGATLILR